MRAFWVKFFQRLYEPKAGQNQGRRQVKICGVNRHGERGAPAYNGGLEADRPPS